MAHQDYKKTIQVHGGTPPTDPPPADPTLGSKTDLYLDRRRMIIGVVVGVALLLGGAVGAYGLSQAGNWAGILLGSMCMAGLLLAAKSIEALRRPKPQLAVSDWGIATLKQGSWSWASIRLVRVWEYRAGRSTVRHLFVRTLSDPSEGIESRDIVVNFGELDVSPDRLVGIVETHLSRFRTAESSSTPVSSRM